MEQSLPSSRTNMFSNRIPSGGLEDKPTPSVPVQPRILPETRGRSQEMFYVFKIFIFTLDV